MGRQGRILVKGGSSATDIMTSLIGCLILLLLGILVIFMATQAMIVTAEPDTHWVSFAEMGSGFRESQAFPHGNTEKQPVYVDVSNDHVQIFRSSAEPVVVSRSDLRRPGNAYVDALKSVRANSGGEYVLFIIRPQGIALARALKKEVLDMGGIDIGTELYDSGRVVDLSDFDHPGPFPASPAPGMQRKAECFENSPDPGSAPDANPLTLEN